MYWNFKTVMTATLVLTVRAKHWCTHAQQCQRHVVRAMVVSTSSCPQGNTSAGSVLSLLKTIVSCLVDTT